MLDLTVHCKVACPVANKVCSVEIKSSNGCQIVNPEGHSSAPNTSPFVSFCKHCDEVSHCLTVLTDVKRCKEKSNEFKSNEWPAHINHRH